MNKKAMKKLEKISIGFMLLISAFNISLMVASSEEVVNVSREISRFKGAKSSEQKLETLGKLRRGARNNSEVGKVISEEVKKEKNPHVKARLVEAMSDFRGNETQKTAREALKDESTNVRFSAVYALGYIGEPSDAQQLIQKFEDSNETKGVRFQAANSLAMRANDAGWPREEIIAVFLKAVESPEPDIRAQAITSLTFVAPDDNRTIEAVKRLLDDKDEFVRKTAIGRAEFLGIK